MFIGAAIAAALVAGGRLGLTRALPFAGFAIGAVLGTRLPLLIGVDLASASALVAALPAALLLGALLAAFAERYAWRLGRPLRRRRTAHTAAGALVSGVACVVTVWMLAPAALEIAALREPLVDSRVLDGFEAVVEPAGPTRTEEPAPIDNLPRYAGRGPDIEPGDPAILFDPDVLAAQRSVIRIETAGCGDHGGGSGWVAAEGIVATNAHVIATAKTITAQPGGRGPRLTAVPIWFDGEHDIALLRVAGVRGVPVLQMVREARPGTAGATLGFPRGRWAIRRARVGPTTDRVSGMLGGRPSPGVSDRIYGRLVTLIRGRTQPGNSGGPVIDGQGRVLTTAFAGGVIGTASLGVPNRFVRAGLRRAGPRVDTSRCR